jgi:hypothetical protein
MIPFFTHDEPNFFGASHGITSDSLAFQVWEVWLQICAPHVLRASASSASGRRGDGVMGTSVNGFFKRVFKHVF